MGLDILFESNFFKNRNFVFLLELSHGQKQSIDLLTMSFWTVGFLVHRVCDPFKRDKQP